jgi:GT2 family glycosyltransferase
VTISVVIVSHNARDHLLHCLERLGQIAGSDIEVVVVDNRSSDGSCDMVRERFPSCRLVQLERNAGFGAGCNRGIAAASGEYLLLLNSDAWLDPASLELLRAELDRDPRLAVVVPQLYYPDGRLQFTWLPETGVVGQAIQLLRNRMEKYDWNHRRLPAILRAILGPGWYTAACMLVRRRAFEEVDGFDERIFMYFEDADLSRRLRLQGWRLAIVPRARAFHVKGGSGANLRLKDEYRRAQLYYYRKHRPAWERWIVERMRGRSLC